MNTPKCIWQIVRANKQQKEEEKKEAETQRQRSKRSIHTKKYSYNAYIRIQHVI